MDGCQVCEQRRVRWASCTGPADSCCSRRRCRLPGWVLPVAGGVLFTVVVVIWYSAALWFLNGYKLPFGT